MGTENKTTYEGTVLDNLNPETTISVLDSLLKKFGTERLYEDIDDPHKFEPAFTKEERDALRHYIGTQAIASKYGPTFARMITNLNEYPYQGNEQEDIDLANNRKAIEDFTSGKIFNPNWINMAENYPLEANSTIELDSLLQHLIVPPKGGEYE